MLREWANPYSGFAVHVTEDDSYLLYSNSLREDVDPAALNVDALFRLRPDVRDGSPLGVLITCSRKPNTSSSLLRLVESLSTPGVQIFYPRAKR